MLTSFWHQINTPVLYAIPFFFLFIAVEVWTLRDRDHVTGYLARDTRTSLAMGVGSLASSLLLKIGVLVGFSYLWAVAPWHVPTDTWWGWALLLVVVDLSLYFNHRFSHRVRIGWAAHRAHHSSEYFNFGTALRQKWNPWSEALFWSPLPLLGFAPWAIYIALTLNLIYQFFTHTETVGKLPRPIEYIFNTPSHHRVHHGSDPEYLDKNYGGIFIVWDRMFGTFQPELHRPRYGLTTPVGTYNLLKLEYGEYVKIVRDVRGADRLRDKLGYIFAPPGWQPAPRPVTAA
ncbi:sterol desaturase family protein [Nocardia sp. NPDC005978]|uniref:sterol desaturase family protein n=1 Tax=Nocardia sp. NPDC005978 TaxID=3156725 RepID=UPI0033BE61DF